MKKYIKPIVAAMLLGAGAATLNAIPAKRGVRTFTQADGSAIEVELVGDEFAHFYITTDGYPLVEKEGNLYYAEISADGKLDTSALKASKISARSADVNSFLGTVDKSLVSKALQYKASQSRMRRIADEAVTGPMRAPQGPGLVPDADFPVTGSPRVLVILAEFADVNMTIADPHDYFTRMLTEHGFSDYGGTGSAIDYFEENSLGQFTPIIDVYGPAKLPRNSSYYGSNDINGNDRNPEQMIIDACAVLDDEIDFSIYDTNNDGFIDNVFVFYAGKSEASGGAASTVWPHAWNVYNGANITKFYDGVQLDRYACGNEWMDGRPDGVGTFIHEFSHVMGLPDLYATRNTNAFTPDRWSVLDYGPYNNDGCTPPLYSAFERYSLGWIEPVLIDGPVSAVLRPIGENICGLIKTDRDNEFFLLENRQQTSWDTYIPGHGMLVWHIDYSPTMWRNNSVNNMSSHQYVDIEEADNLKSDFNRGGDAFPGTANITSFTDDTWPSMKTWAGKGLGLPITDIAENGSIISFNVAGGKAYDPVETPKANAATKIEPDGFTANWVAAEGISYLLSVYTKDENGNKIYTKYNRSNTGKVSSFDVKGLKSETDYYYTVAAINVFDISDASNEIAVRTLRPGIESLAIEAMPASAMSADGFTANWVALPEATNYLLTVYEHTDGDPLEFYTGFDNNKLPAGWTTSKHAFSSLPNRYGKDKPAISLAYDNYIETAAYDDIISVRLWHRASNQCEGQLLVSGKIGGEWKEARSLDLVKTTDGVTDEVEMPAGTSAIRFEYKGSGGSIAIDDISIRYGHETIKTVVAPFDSYDVGNANSYDVDGLKPGCRYSYIVQGTDGVKNSKKSAEIKVNTIDPSGIGSTVAGESLKVVVSGNTVGVYGIDENLPATVCDIAGRVVASAKGPATFTLPAGGVYIVRAGAASAKVLLR